MPQKTIIATEKNVHAFVFSEIQQNGNNADLNHIDVSGVTDMTSLFFRSEFYGDISKWNTAHVKHIERLFYRSK
jgi:hypothetical protein